jgi:hypothetical protein
VAYNNQLRAGEPVEGAADEHVRVHQRAPAAPLRPAGGRAGQSAPVQRGLGSHQQAAREFAAAVRRADQRAPPAAEMLGDAAGDQHLLLRHRHHHATLPVFRLQQRSECVSAHALHLLLCCRLLSHFLHRQAREKGKNNHFKFFHVFINDITSKYFDTNFQ